MLPTFIVIGAMKGGTTSLYQYLRAHPEICMSSTKETDFFIREKNYALGRRWYESQFPTPAKERGEASPNYSKWPHYQGVPERMHDLVPHARLLYVVRDPIERMISHYGHRIAKHWEQQPIDQALQPSSHKYVTPSRYFTQLCQFRRFYPQEQILVVSSEDLREDRRATLRRIFEFLEVDAGFECRQFNREFHRTDGKFNKKASWREQLLSRLGVQPNRRPRSLPARELSDGTRQALIESLLPEVENLRRATGLSFARWCL
jgi:hypothetical protein